MTISRTSFPPLCGNRASAPNLSTVNIKNICRRSLEPFFPLIGLCFADDCLMFGNALKHYTSILISRDLQQAFI